MPLKLQSRIVFDKQKTLWQEAVDIIFLSHSAKINISRRGLKISKHSSTQPQPQLQLGLIRIWLYTSTPHQPTHPRQELTRQCKLSQIIDHLKKNDLFHQDHLTATRIVQLHNIWLEAADEKEMSADQTAAYDLLCHDILKEKLDLCYNFSEEAIAWVMSYLGKRTQ